MKITQETKEKIFSAASALLASGVEAPTNDQVREFLGGGSLSHISPAMREWREQQKAAVEVTPEIPDAVKNAMNTALSQIWSSASRLAATENERIRQETNAATAVVITERDEAFSEITHLEQIITDLRHALEERTLALHQTQENLDARTTEVTQLTTENAALTAQVSGKDEQILSLKEAVKAARNDARTLQEQLIAIAQRGSPRIP